MVCFKPKNKRGFKITKYMPGIANKNIKDETKTNFLKLILFINKVNRKIKKKI